MAAPKSDKPAPVALNLDTLDREARPEPFTIVLGGKPYTFEDPQDIDWRILLDALSNPRIFFDVALSTKQAAAFNDNKLPGWKLNALIDAYLKHYGLPSVPEALALPRR